VLAVTLRCLVHQGEGVDLRVGSVLVSDSVITSDQTAGAVKRENKTDKCAENRAIR